MIDKIYNVDCMAHMAHMAADSVQMTLTDIPYSEMEYPTQSNVWPYFTLDKGQADELTFELSDFVNELIRFGNYLPFHDEVPSDG